MHKPRSRIQAEPFAARSEGSRANVENMFIGIHIRDRARKSAGLYEGDAPVLPHPHTSVKGPPSGHPVMRILDVIVIGLSMVTGPLLLLLSVAGLSWAGLRWAGLG